MFVLDRRVLALSVARAADAVGNSFLIVLLPLYIDSGLVTGNVLGLSAAAVTGIVLSVFGFVNSGVQPFTGRLSDRTGKRKVFILLGLAILAASTFAYLLADTYLTLLILRGIQGVGVAFTIPCTLALVNELATTENRGANMGTYNTFRLAGFGAGPVVAGFMVHHGPYTLGLAGRAVDLTGFQASFGFATLAALVGFLLVTLLVHDPEHTRMAAAGDLRVDVFSDLPGRVLDPIFTLGLVTLFMAIAIALLASIEPIVNARLGQSPGMFGLQFSAFLVPQVLLQAPIGNASDERGRLPFILWGMIFLVPTTLAQGLVTGPWQMVTVRVLQGVAGAMVFAPGLAMAGDLAKAHTSGTSMSVMTMSFGLGIAVGPLVSGFLVAYGFVVPFAVGAVVAGLGAVLVATQLDETATLVQAGLPDEGGPAG